MSSIFFFISNWYGRSDFNVYRNRWFKSTDIYEIWIKPVKYVIHFISHCLSHIYNRSLLRGHFPIIKQKAKVSVIYKKGDKNMLCNYRPITVLRLFSKGLEKTILLRLTIFFAKYSIITNSQYGFRRGCYIELALLQQIELILNKLENKPLVLGVFIDYRKR